MPINAANTRDVAGRQHIDIKCVHNVHHPSQCLVIDLTHLHTSLRSVYRVRRRDDSQALACGRRRTEGTTRGRPAIQAMTESRPAPPTGADRMRANHAAWRFVLTGVAYR